MMLQIGEIAEQIPLLPADAKCGEADAIFRGNPSLQGIAVVCSGRPTALIMRNRFYQQLGTLYGYNLYMGRPIGLLMDNEPLVVDYGILITDVSRAAMNRTEDRLYDYVLVTLSERMYGAVSVRDLLLNFAEIKAETATALNPLTGLPGNRNIEEWMRASLGNERFAVLYVDLDHFKVYNDTYGFKEGDRLIAKTADILRTALAGDGLLGHIGGDDFIAILSHYGYEDKCRDILNAFDDEIAGFYSPLHYREGYVVGEDRSGVTGRFPLVTLSIAVVTNRFRTYDSTGELSERAALIKKKCKRMAGSCCVAD